MTSIGQRRPHYPLVRFRGCVFSVMAFTVTNGEIAQIEFFSTQSVWKLELTIPPTSGKRR